MPTVTLATDAAAWDSFLAAQPYRPFLQSWTMGDVYAQTGQEPIRLVLQDGGAVRGICHAVLVPARRGRHLSVPYGPVVQHPDDAVPLLEALANEARSRQCTFLRLSPFWSSTSPWPTLAPLRVRRAPLHLLAEHLWYLPLRESDGWPHALVPGGARLTEELLLGNMRKTTRNLIRRAQKDGVTVEASPTPLTDLEHFIRLHDETRKRHKFTPYSNGFFRAQVAHFAPRGEITVYLARHAGQVIAASVHMHAMGETSYHHGASSSAHQKIPASYLLQWTAITDALKRGDHVYNFWGIAPTSDDAEGGRRVTDPRHPFAGVTLFKTGFGGSLHTLTHCVDVPLSPRYELTRAFEFVRKWKRGF